jgi:acyl-coenzyme A thioesterase PaaI-like protein
LAFIRVDVKNLDEEIVAFANFVLSTESRSIAASTEEASDEARSRFQVAGPAATWLVDASNGISFLQNLQVTVLGVTQRNEIVLKMPNGLENFDSSGNVDVSALLGLLDAAGSAAPWLGRDAPTQAGATILLQARLHFRAARGPVLAIARVTNRQQRDVWVNVRIVSEQRGEVYLTGNIAYRMPKSL